MSNTPARIDETLARGAERRERVIRALERLRDRDPSKLRLRQIARQLQLVAADAPLFLVDRVVEASPAEFRVLLSLLPEYRDLRVRERLLRLRKQKGLDPEAAQRLEQARIAVEQQLAPFGMPEDLVKAQPQAVWSYVAGSDWRDRSPQSCGMVWIDNFFVQSQTVRRRLLDELLLLSPSHFLPIAEMEAHWGGKTSGPWIAKKLKAMHQPAARSLLSRLRLHRDPETAAIADAALRLPPVVISRFEIAEPITTEEAPGPLLAYILEERPKPAGRRPALPNAPAKTKERQPKGPGAVVLHASPAAALAAATATQPALQPAPKVINVVLAQVSASGLISYVSMVLDFRDRGLIDCFGEENIEPERFRELLRMAAADATVGDFREVPSALGLMLANGGIAQALRSGAIPPREYFLWRHLAADRSYDASVFAGYFRGQLKRKLGPFLSRILHNDASQPSPW